MARKIKKPKIKTQLELLQGIRRKAAPPSRRHGDARKEQSRKACRGRTRDEE